MPTLGYQSEKERASDSRWGTILGFIGRRRLDPVYADFPNPLQIPYQDAMVCSACRVLVMRAHEIPPDPDWIPLHPENNVTPALCELAPRLAMSHTSGCNWWYEPGENRRRITEKDGHMHFTPEREGKGGEKKLGPDGWSMGTRRAEMEPDMGYILRKRTHSQGPS